MFYTPILSREETGNAVVGEGAILLFSEDGKSLTAKMPDGSYQTISGGALQEMSAAGGSVTMEIQGGTRYIFNTPLSALTLIPAGGVVNDPEEQEFQFTAADGFSLNLPDGVALAAGQGIAAGYVTGATYILNIRSAVAIIARIFPGGKLPPDALEERVAALEAAVGTAAVDMAAIIGEA